MTHDTPDDDAPPENEHSVATKLREALASASIPKFYTVTITATDGRKFEARGVNLSIEVWRESFEIRATGLFESQDEMMRRLSAGPQHLRCSFELRIEEGSEVSIS